MKTYLFIIYNLGGGGAEKVFAKLVAHVQANPQRKIHVLTFQDQGVYKEQIIALSNVTYHTLSIDQVRVNFLIQAWKVRKLIRQIKPEFILSFLYYPNIITYLALLGQKIKHVPAERSNHRKYFGHGLKWRIWGLLLKKSYLNAWKILSNSLDQKKHIVEDFGVDSDKISVVHNGIDLDDLDNKSKDSVDWQQYEGKKVVLAVGRFTKAKAYPVLLESFRILINRMQDDSVVLLILGEGELEGVVRNKIQELKLESHVVLNGFVGNPAPYLKHADVYVLSSQFEGFPNALLEAYWLNGHVVSTDCETGPGEIITNEKDGLLVPVNDSKRLAEALCIMLTDHSLRERVRLESHNRAKRFSVENMLARYDQILFEDALEQTKK